MPCREWSDWSSRTVSTNRFCWGRFDFYRWRLSSSKRLIEFNLSRILVDPGTTMTRALLLVCLCKHIFANRCFQEDYDLLWVDDIDFEKERITWSHHRKGCSRVFRLGRLVAKCIPQNVALGVSTLYDLEISV